MNLNEHLNDNSIKYKDLGDSLYEIIGFGKSLLSQPKDRIFDHEFNLIFNQSEIELLSNNEVEYILYEFGEAFYYTKCDRRLLEFTSQEDIWISNLKATLQELRWVGECDSEYSEDFFIHLGVHTEYELLNGCHSPDLWVKKAKFLKMKSLAICDKNTLAGTLAFQNECVKKEIKSILGMTADVKYEDEMHEVVLYAKNENGWRNLLQINKQINVENHKECFIHNDVLLSLSSDLVCVLGKNSFLYKNPKNLTLIKKYKKAFKDIYWAWDTVEYYDNDKDIQHLSTIKELINQDLIPPVLINDSYYIDKDMYLVKRYANIIGKKSHYFSEDQYFKTIGNSMSCLKGLFKSDKSVDVATMAICNTAEIAELCDFKIETGKAKLPKYIPKEDISSKDLFFDIIQKGVDFKLKDVDDIDMYMERLTYEIDVIYNAGFADYFLILWDIIKFVKDSGHFVGTGRGSVGGSMLAYIMDITDVDPIKYDLMFERFLNPTRISGERAKQADALPDIDVDFPQSFRDEIKKYLEDRFGIDYVCSVGAYGTLGLRAGIKDLSKVKGLDFTYVNYITKFIEHQVEYTWRDLISFALNSDDKFKEQSNELYKYIQNNPEIVNLLRYMLYQCKSFGVHASAVLILPRVNEKGEDMSIFDWLPVSMVDGSLVSQWEGKYIDSAGFLKEDLLGLTQLDKFEMIVKLIKENYNEDVEMREIPMDDDKTMNLFKRGYNEDVFQFTSSGLKNYSTKVKPTGIEDLIAMTALWRPGPMGSNAHMDYVDFKWNRKTPKFDYGLKEVTDKTFGLYIYQEQIMKAVNVLGGLSLSQADEVRTIMKKFDKKKMQTFKDLFLAGAIEKGCSEHEAEVIWTKLEKFSGYGFNRSHSAAYSIMSYQCQWLKANYPLEFWTAALNFAKDDDRPSILSEMKKVSPKIQLKNPDINHSGVSFNCSVKTNSIYWNISSIAGIGPSSVLAILNERSKGQYKDFDDFLKRIKKVNKKQIVNLVYAGCFDDLMGIEVINDRKYLLMYLHKLKYIDELDQSQFHRELFWILKQKDLTGLGFVNYKKLLFNFDKKFSHYYSENDEFFKKGRDFDIAVVAGEVMFAVERKTKKGALLNITIQSNNEIIQVLLWNDAYVRLKEKCKDLKGKSIAILGKIKFDTYRNTNALYSFEETDLLFI